MSRIVLAHAALAGGAHRAHEISGVRSQKFISVIGLACIYDQ